MADAEQDDVLELEDVIEIPADDAEPQPEAEEQEAEAEAPAESDGEIIIDADDADPSDENKTIREMRRTIREQSRELKALKERDQPAATDPGPRPKLADFDFDEDAHEKAVDEWIAKRERFAIAERERQEAERAAQATWQKIENDYRAKAATLGISNFEAREEMVETALNPVVMRAVKAYAADPAKVIAALGSNHALLDKIASEADPLRALVMLIKMEDKMQVRRRAAVTEPDKPVRGTASVATGGKDKEEARLEAEAQRTGDMTKLFAYRRKMRQQADSRR